MNVQFYIESGMLEQYVLGKLCAEESRVLEDLCARHPDLAAERDAIELALYAVAASESKKAPAFNKAAIIQKAAQENIATPSTTEVPAMRAIVNNTWRNIALAASVAALIGIGLSLFNNKAKNEVAAELATTKSIQEKQAQELKIVKNPNYKAINLAGLDSTKTFEAAIVYYNAKAQDVYIAWNEKAQLASNEQYQLWAIVDGKPVDAGVFNEQSDLQKMKLISKASAFAITIEKVGGSATPTMNRMVCMGGV
jgi:anti-sigma-K factor RskA